MYTSSSSRFRLLRNYICASSPHRLQLQLNSVSFNTVFRLLLHSPLSHSSDEWPFSLIPDAISIFPCLYPFLFFFLNCPFFYSTHLFASPSSVSPPLHHIFPPFNMSQQCNLLGFKLPVLLSTADKCMFSTPYSLLPLASVPPLTHRLFLHLLPLI